MPARLTPESEATPDEFVVGHAGVVAPPQTTLPLSSNVTVLPLTPEPPEVSVAERFAMPPYVPVAAEAVSAVAAFCWYTAWKSRAPLKLPVTQMTRGFAGSITKKDPAGPVHSLKVHPDGWLAEAEASSRTESLPSTPRAQLFFALPVVVEPTVSTGLAASSAFDVQLLFNAGFTPLWTFGVSVNLTSFAPVATGEDVTPTFPSVKLVVATEPDEPVALTLYRATNQSGRLKESVMAPSASAVTSTSRLQLRPSSSLTERCTASPPCQ